MRTTLDIIQLGMRVDLVLAGSSTGKLLRCVLVANPLRISETRVGQGVRSYQLVQIPSANRHVATVLIHALGELLSRALAVVAPVVVLLLSRSGIVVGARQGRWNRR